MDSTIPWQVVLVCVGKLAKHEPSSKQHSSRVPWPELMCRIASGPSISGPNCFQRLPVTRVQAKSTPFSSELCLFRVFYYSNRNETRSPNI